MLGFPALMLLGIGCVYLFTALSDKLLYVFTITLICNVISLPFTIGIIIYFMRFMVMQLKNILAKGYLVPWLNIKSTRTLKHIDTLLTLLPRGKRGYLTNR